VNTAAVLECAKCETPYVLRYTLSVSEPCYAFYRDCKCRSAEARVRRNDHEEPIRVRVMSDG
jgi:hypothetical protein